MVDRLWHRPARGSCSSPPFQAIANKAPPPGCWRGGGCGSGIASFGPAVQHVNGRTNIPTSAGTPVALPLS